MIIVYMLASLLGASATAAALWPTGWLLAILCAPLGGSAFTLAIAFSVAATRASKDVTEGLSVQA